MKTQCFIYILALMSITSCKPDNTERTDPAKNQQSTSNYNYTEHQDAQSAQVTYFHSCQSGCVVVRQDGSKKVSYRIKCNSCGQLQNVTHNILRSHGNLNRSYRCSKCGQSGKVILSTMSYRK